MNNQLQPTGLDLFYINTITLGTVSMAFLVSFWLPMPQKSMFFKGEKAAAVGCQQEGPQGEKRPEASVTEKDGEGSGKGKMEHNGRAGYCSRGNVATAGHLLWQSFRESYSSRHFSFNISLKSLRCCECRTSVHTCT